MPAFTAPDGTRLAYHVVGDGEPLICLPGGPMRASAYLGDLGGLSKRRRLVLLDLRGTGDSDVPADPSTYRCDRQADDVEALRVRLGLERVDLLAHSAAGDLALLYAARYPGASAPSRWSPPAHAPWASTSPRSTDSKRPPCAWTNRGSPPRVRRTDGSGTAPRPTPTSTRRCRSSTGAGTRPPGARRRRGRADQRAGGGPLRVRWSLRPRRGPRRPGRVGRAGPGSGGRAGRRPAAPGRRRRRGAAPARRTGRPGRRGPLPVGRRPRSLHADGGLVPGIAAAVRAVSAVSGSVS